MTAPVSLLRRHARIDVFPNPTTLSETSAILKAFQSFGPICSFLNPRYVLALRSRSPSKLYVKFKENEALEKARLASPLTVHVGHNAVDPEEADPFDVRGIWNRKKVERKTFTCLVAVDSGTYHDGTCDRQIIEANPYHGPFRVDSLPVSFQDLRKQGAPSAEFADCVQKRQVNQVDRARFEQEARRRSFYRIADNGEVTGGLMDTWRENLGSGAAFGQDEADEAE